MAKPAHTPGPWHITSHGNDKSNYIPIYTEDGLWITEAKGRGGIRGSMVGPNNNDEIAANAALIAAAPDMLEALQHIASLPILEITSGDIGKCRDAIAKATTFELSK
jgi:hypothetical protein